MAAVEVTLVVRFESPVSRYVVEDAILLKFDDATIIEYEVEEV